MSQRKLAQSGKLIPILLAAVIVIVGYLVYSKQQEREAQAAAQALAAAQITEIKKLAERWDDAMKIAMASSRIALTDPVQELQKIRRDTNNAETPQCFSQAKSYLVSGMDNFIEGILGFMQNNEASSAPKIKAGKTDFDLFKEHAKDCVDPKS